MSSRAPSRRSRWLEALDRVPDWSVVVLAGASLLGGYVLVATSGTAVSVSRHVFYIPIVLVAVRFGTAGGVGVGVVAGLVAGPVATAAEPAVWMGRGVAFALVGFIVGAFSSARQGSLRAESDVAERERALIAQRVALVQIISHELRTPLTILRGSVETLIARDVVTEPGGRDLILAMERSARRLQDMVEVTMAAAGDVEGDDAALRDVDVAALVEHAVASLPDRVRQRLHVDIPPGASLVTGESALWLTLRCLLDNADKFSPENGVVRVRFAERDDLAVISVEDDGPGLPQGFAEAAFEPFVQADTSESRTHPGLGMGLYTARRLARRLGGEVVLHSRATQPGSLAEVLLPKDPPLVGDRPAETTARPRDDG